MTIEAVREKFDTGDFTPEILEAVKECFKKEGFKPQPLVAEIVLGRMPNSLEADGLIINQKTTRYPFTIIDQQKDGQRQLPTQAIYFSSFSDYGDYGYLEFLNTEEEDEIRKDRFWSPVQDWERQNVQAILNKLIRENLSKTFGIKWVRPTLDLLGQLSTDYLQRTEKYFLPNSDVWTSDRCRIDRGDHKEELERYVVAGHFGEDGVDVSYLPGGTSGAGLLLIGLSETVDTEEYNLELVYPKAA